MSSPLKRKDSEPTFSVRPTKQCKTQSRRYLPLPVEIIIHIGEYLDDRSRVPLISISKKNIRKMAPTFWCYFEKRSAFRLVDLEHLPSKIRYFCQKKLLDFMTSTKEGCLSLEDARATLDAFPTLEGTHEVAKAQQILCECVSWSVMTQSMGQSNLPAMLQNSMQRHFMRGTPSDALMAGWIAAHNTKETAKACFREALHGREPAILETNLILYNFPALSTLKERMQEAKHAADKGFLEPLELALLNLDYSEKKFKKLEKFPSAHAWKARDFLDNDAYAEAVASYEVALKGYKKLMPLTKVSIVVLRDAIYAYTKIENYTKAAQLSRVLMKAYAEKRIPVPDCVLLESAWNYFQLNNYKKVISLLTGWQSNSSVTSQTKLHNAFYLLSYSFGEIDNLDEALKYGALCLAHGTPTGEDLSHVAELHYRNEEYFTAMDLYQTAIQKYHEDNEAVPATLYVSLAEACKNLNLVNNYAENLEKAYEIFQKDGFKNNLLSLQIAAAYEKINEYEKALLWYNRSVTIEGEYLTSFIKVQLRHSNVDCAFTACDRLIQASIGGKVLPSDEMTMEIQPLLDAIDPSALSTDSCITLTNLYVALRKKRKVLSLVDHLLKATVTFSLKSWLNADIMTLCRAPNELEPLLKYHTIVIQTFAQKGKVPAPLYASLALLYFQLQNMDSANRSVGLAFLNNDGSFYFPPIFYKTAALIKQNLGDSAASKELFLSYLERGDKTTITGDIYWALATIYAAESNTEEAIRYITLAREKKCMPDCSLVEKIAKEGLSQGKIEQAIANYHTVVAHVLAQGQNIPNELRDQIADLSARAQQVTLSSLSLTQLATIHALLGDEDLCLSFVELEFQNPALSQQETEQLTITAATRSLTSGNFPKICEMSERALQSNFSFACLANLGLINLQAQNISIAILLLERAIANANSCNQKTKSMLCLDLGLSYALAGEPSKAIEIWKGISEHIKPKNYQASHLMLIARTYIEHGYQSIALKYYEYACESVGKNSPSQEIIERVEKIASTSMDDSIVMGKIFLKFQRYKEAISLFKQVLREKNLPQDCLQRLQSYFYLADAYVEQGKLQKAQAYYLLAKSASAANPNFAAKRFAYSVRAITIKLSGVSIKLGDMPQAREYFDETLLLPGLNYSTAPDSVKQALAFTATDQPIVAQENDFFGHKRLAELTQYCHFFKEHLQLGWPGHHSVYRIKVWMDKQIQHLHLIHENNLEFLMAEAHQLPQPEEVLKTLQVYAQRK